MRRLWGRLSSVNVQKAVWGLEELGLPYERVEAGGAFGRVRDPDYRALNPNSLVPVLEEDGFVLWESNAILRYLARSHDLGGLWPDHPQAAALVDQWLDWQATRFTPATRDAFWQTVRTPPEQRDQSVIDRSVAASEECAAILDAHLMGRPYAVGDHFTAADIALAAAAHRWLHLDVPRIERPALRAWYDRIRTRPAAAVALPPLS
ncbi:glutathione S-transferase family protein [Methylobacterium currus]|jgi:glutathione S-transferase|uniref:Glutathione S-transferase family protein n=1 Tax=Methylobacterium currus TaxID=2051553 RepID=A0A2R4WHQ3_9HYPH|nr:glutathione S-transferase family protein [Methylobacterium currus]AWB21070.1 glutathione S-transferase family protein [Methylobacterium currus]UHC14091.1 glutathione S-transferase family protein [Methylobacterium currus]